jgi:hypothetical protein
LNFNLICFAFQGSRDNMSIIIIAFPAAPKVDPEAQRKDEELNKLLQQKVAGQSTGVHSRTIDRYR